LWTGAVSTSYQLLDPSYGYQKSIFQKEIQERICISENNSINYTSRLHIHYLLKEKLPVMKMLVFNFQNMMDMQKDYAYKIFNFVAFKKLIRI
jgi:hypothetical protein